MSNIKVKILALKLFWQNQKNFDTTEDLLSFVSLEVFNQTNVRLSEQLIKKYLNNFTTTGSIE